MQPKINVLGEREVATITACAEFKNADSDEFGDKDLAMYIAGWLAAKRNSIVAAERAAIKPAGEAIDFDALRKVIHELRTYSPPGDRYNGVHIHPGWADKIEAAISVPQQAKAEQDFAAWLNERRMSDVSSVFHEIVAKYAEALNVTDRVTVSPVRCDKCNGIPNRSCYCYGLFATPAAPAAHSEVGEFPPLPEPLECISIAAGTIVIEGDEAYNADQMRAYGQLCRQTAPSSVNSAVSDAQTIARLTSELKKAQTLHFNYVYEVSRIARYEDPICNFPETDKVRELIANIAEQSCAPTAPAIASIGDDALVAAWFAKNDKYIVKADFDAWLEQAYRDGLNDARSPVAAAPEVASLRNAFMTLESSGGEGRTIVLKFNQRADAYNVHQFLLNVATPTASTPPAPACRMQGGVCSCRSGGSFGGCRLEREDCCAAPPAPDQAAQVGAMDEKGDV